MLYFCPLFLRNSVSQHSVSNNKCWQKQEVSHSFELSNNMIMLQSMCLPVWSMQEHSIQLNTCYQIHFHFFLNIFFSFISNKCLFELIWDGNRAKNGFGERPIRTWLNPPSFLSKPLLLFLTVVCCCHSIGCENNSVILKIVLQYVWKPMRWKHWSS